MQSNSHKTSTKIEILISRTLEKVPTHAFPSLGRFVMLGISARQWTACMLICALLSISVAAPVGLSMPRALNNDSANFEPVNEETSLFTSTFRGLNAEIEAKLTPWRSVNWSASDNSNTDDKTTKPPTSDDKTIGDEDKDKPSTEPKKNDAESSEHLPDQPLTEPAISQSTNTTSVATMPVAPPDEPILTEAEVQNMLLPDNNLGNPPGQTEMSSSFPAAAARTRERHGSSNYSFGIPVASLPGRGLDAGIGINYNSRVWNKSGTTGALQFDFNIDNNWLAPGFEMSLGEFEGYYSGSGYGYLVTGPDGTRHQLIARSSSGGCTLYESTDGTFIQTTSCGPYNYPTMVVKYPDGSQVTYGALTASGKRFPSVIMDRNGNYLTISYIANDTNGKIASIRDTLARFINFHYDNTTEKNLVAVTVPGFNGGAERQVVRFYYEQMNLQWQNRFNGTVVAPTSVNVLRHVYYPGTQTGYRYDYSPYFGVIYKIWQLRDMQVSTTSLTETGTVSGNHTVDPSNWAAWTHYNYAVTPMDVSGPPLSDVPKYNWRKDDFVGRTSAIPQTYFHTAEDVTPVDCDIALGNCTGTRTTTITAPDNTISVSVSKIRPSGDWENGLLSETRLETTVSGTQKVWSKTKLFWQQGENLPTGRDNPRLSKTEVTNDANQTRATSFEYDTYNNPTVVKEHDFAAPDTFGTELRRTETTYETGEGWIYNRLIRLPKTMQTIVNGTVVSKSKYEYDNNGASGTTNLVLRPDIDQSTHNIKYNPSYPTYYYCIPGCNITSYCCHWIVQYQGTTDYRGNVTKVIEFPDTSAPDSDPNNVIKTVKYDIAGNAVESGASCCKEKEWTYVKENEYAYPVTEKRGDQGQLQTSFTYDRNTGLVKTATDENNQVSTVTYNTSNLRVTRTDSPNGAWTTTEYNDAVFPYHVKSTASLDATRSVSSWSFANGIGQQFRTRGQTADGYVSSDVEFDEMGRPKKAFSPYTVANLNDARPSGIKSREITQRDGLGRTLTTVLPDLTTVTVSYNGPAATATDQAGKSRRRLADALGRTIRVDEPDANGNLGDVATPTQPTYYEYDGNDNLTKVTQTGSGVTQERLFKYDALSRLTHEREVEATATLDTNGVKVGSGGLWTGVYKYTNENLLLEGIDARGVKSSFTYDGLNRTQSVAFAGETGYQTPTVTYTYDEAESGFYNNGRRTKVQTAANATYGIPATVQNYDYDNVGQVVKHIQLIDNQTYQLEYGYNLAGQLTSEKYPSGRIVANTIDNFTRLATVADASRSYLTGVSFNNQGLLSQMNLGNGTAQTFVYNDRFQMTSQSLNKGAEVLQKYDYSYGTTDLASGSVDTSKNNGQLGKIEGWIGANKEWSQRFGYDELGRLSEAREYKQGDNAQLTYKQKFDFDRFGNLYRKAANNNPSGQQHPLPYTAIEETTTPLTGDIDKQTNRFRTGTTYDDAGQVINDTKFRSMGFGYDANGRMVKATKANSPDASTVYDALGNRVATKINDVWTFVIYDAFGKLLADYGGISGTDDGGVRYVMQDWQGSPRAVVSNTGYILSRSDFTAFGEEIQSGIGLRTAQQGYNTPNQSRHGYGLTEKDDASGLNHTWFRKNENKAGRWTSPDPYKGSTMLGNPQSFNRYTYVENEPTNFVDPSGLYWAIDYGSCRVTGVILYGGWDGDIFYWNGNYDLIVTCNLYWVNDSPVGGGEPPVGGGGQPAPLSDKEKEKLRKKNEKIKKNLKKKKCKDFLESHGISILDLETQLDNSSSHFSGPGSSNITVEEAGLMGEDARENLEAMEAGQARDSGLAVLGWSVKEWFKRYYNGRVKAAVGSGGRVFYKDFGATTHLHESLHVSTGLKDIELADKLGLKHNGTIESASQAISAALKANGCS
ncbi:MAG: RHS repeat domain-containing protein [Pyrinomonadaceae bacterium]